MEWQQEFKAEFPVTQNQIYVNVAFHNPTPNSVKNAMCEFLREVSQGIDSKNKNMWLGNHAFVREKLAKLVNGKPHEIAFTKNTTEGINIIAQCTKWRPGDNVVINDQEHICNVLPWLNLRHRGVEVRIVKHQNYRLPVDHIMSMVDKKTRVVAISDVQYSSGFRADLASLGARCHETGIRLIVDAIQSIGFLEFDAHSWEVDAVACGGHKGLLGLTGIGFLYCKEDLWKELIPIYTGFSEAVSLKRTDEFSFEISDPTDARRFEYGNLNYVGIIGLEAGLNLLEKAGINRIEKWVLNLSRLLDSGLRKLGYQVISSSIPQEQSGIVVVEVPDPADFSGYLKSNGILAAQQKTTGRIRFSFHAYNDEKEVERILEVASDYDNR